MNQSPAIPACDAADAVAIPRAIPWMLLVLSTASLAAATPRAGIALDYAEFSALLQMLATAALLTAVASSRGVIGLSRAAELLETIALFLAITATCALASYASAAWSLDYADGWLARADAAIGFSWEVAYNFTASSRLLQIAGRCAYISIGITPLVILAVLVLTGRVGRARRFILAYWLTLAVTILFFPLAPAVGPMSAMNPDLITYMPISGVENNVVGHAVSIDAARAGTLGKLTVGSMIGIISFPSFHAAAAVLFMWAAWPVERLRWPVTLLNLAMLCSTIVEGNHYLVDLFAGIAVAAVAIRGSRAGRFTTSGATRATPAAGTAVKPCAAA